MTPAHINNKIATIVLKTKRVCDLINKTIDNLARKGEFDLYLIYGNDTKSLNAISIKDTNFDYLMKYYKDLEECGYKIDVCSDYVHISWK